MAASLRPTVSQSGGRVPFFLFCVMTSRQSFALSAPRAILCASVSSSRLPVDSFLFFFALQAPPPTRLRIWFDAAAAKFRNSNRWTNESRRYLAITSNRIEDGTMPFNKDGRQRDGSGVLRRD